MSRPGKEPRQQAFLFPLYVECPERYMGRDSREVTDSPSKLFFLNIFYLTQNMYLLEFQKPEGKSMRVEGMLG